MSCACKLPNSAYILSHISRVVRPIWSSRSKITPNFCTLIAFQIPYCFPVCTDRVLFSEVRVMARLYISFSNLSAFVSCCTVRMACVRASACVFTPSGLPECVRRHLLRRVSLGQQLPPVRTLLRVCCSQGEVCFFLACT